uniref:Eosinophil peroxidase n=1 Tax=Hucho hucho TaxID=62062 RepID=A0A4W5PWT2_9TELE
MSVHRPACLFICLPVCSSACLSVHRPACLSDNMGSILCPSRVKTSLSEGALRPSDLLAQFKQIGPQTRRHISAAELLDNTVELIREMVYTSTMPQSSLPGTMQRPRCKTGCLSERYRSFTGECNNRHHPKWGAANTPYSRWLPPEYEDVRGVPRGWDPEHIYYNYTLPPVRLVSQDVLYTHNENISLDSSLSHLLVEWGQWIDHDFALTPQSPSTAAFRTGADCTRTCSRDTPCFPIQIPLSDPRTGIQSCMPFFRSAPSCVGSETFPGATPHHHREQLNAITSFVDASMVYGSSSPMAAALRNLSSPLGLLALNDQASDQGLLFLLVIVCLWVKLPVFCCLGDSRANEHLGMIALHTLFLREHNRLVKELHLLNPHWSPDTLYQEARKIMGAVHQILTWEHYLPRVLGETPTSLLMPPYRGYDPEIDPSIANVFSAAAFRFAHVTVQPMVARLGPGYSLASQHPPLPLHHSLFASWRVVQEGEPFYIRARFPGHRLSLRSKALQTQGGTLRSSDSLWRAGRLQADLGHQLNGVSSDTLVQLASGLSGRVLRSVAWRVMFQRMHDSTFTS